MRMLFFSLFLFFGCIIVTAQEYLNIPTLERIVLLEKQEEIRDIETILNRSGYYKKSDKLYSDYNKFGDKWGNELSFHRLVDSDKQRTYFSFYYRLSDTDLTAKDKYVDALIGNGYQLFFESDLSYWYKNDGKIWIHIYKARKNGKFELRVQNNEDGRLGSTAKKIADNKVEVTSFTTAIPQSVKKGQKIRFSASGKITVGMFAGSTGPDGIDGFQLYNVVSGAKHGALIGKIGPNGQWFLIGSRREIIADADGKIYVQVNDRDTQNNSGKFILEYWIE